jgi:hypothetical protein
MKETIIGKKTAWMILVSFLVSLKSPDCPDSLAAVTLISENVIISIGMTKTQAFHTPISKAGVGAIIPFPPSSPVYHFNSMCVLFQYTSLERPGCPLVEPDCGN